MALRNIFRNRRRTPSGLNPASVLRPTQGITPRPSEQVLEQPTGATSIQDEQMSSSAPDSNSEVTSLDNISDKVVQVENESSLPYVRNPYPVEIGTDPSGNYTAAGGAIKLTGKYDENFLTFKKIAIDDIQTFKGNIKFLVQFVDNNQTWTSEGYKQQLQVELNTNNPYINRNTVSVVSISNKFLSQYTDSPKFKIGEAYAETTVTQNFKEIQEILKHIDWMCGSNSNTLRLASSMGTEVFSSIIDEAAPDFLGFDHEEEVDALINGDGTLPTPTQNVSTDIGESTSAEPSSGGGGSTTTTTTSSPPINDMFPPFGFPGTALFEKQTFQGTEYEWRSERIGLFGDRGTDNGTWMRVNTNTTQTNSTTSNLPIGNITMGTLGNSFGGGKIICGELYRQGFLSEEVWEADQEFGKLLFKTHPRVMLGYTFWARNVVKYMKENPSHTKYLYRIFKPWTEQMAYTMGISNKYNIVGSVTQKIGFVYSLIVYNYYQIKWKRFTI
tara:strand:+ start:41 stop:1537 length:1497 start_codon:yes stop_codon:yes gene_type:complete